MGVVVSGVGLIFNLFVSVDLVDLFDTRVDAENIRQQEEKKRNADTTKQELPSNNTGEAAGGAELAPDNNNNPRGGRQLGAIKKVENQCEYL